MEFEDVLNKVLEFLHSKHNVVGWLLTIVCVVLLIVIPILIIIMVLTLNDGLITFMTHVIYVVNNIYSHIQI